MKDSKLETIDKNKITPIIEIVENEPTISHRVIAEHTGIKDRSVTKLITDNVDDFEEFGVVRFKIARDSETKLKNTDAKPIKTYYLNEPQSTLLMTYLRNNDVVKRFKISLVKEFYKLKQINKSSTPSTKENKKLFIDSHEMLVVDGELMIRDIELGEIMKFDRRDRVRERIRVYERRDALPDDVFRMKQRSATGEDLYLTRSNSLFMVKKRKHKDKDLFPNYINNLFNKLEIQAFSTNSNLDLNLLKQEEIERVNKLLEDKNKEVINLNKQLIEIKKANSKELKGFLKSNTPLLPTKDNTNLADIENKLNKEIEAHSLLKDKYITTIENLSNLKDELNKKENDYNFINNERANLSDIEATLRDHCITKNTPPISIFKFFKNISHK